MADDPPNSFYLDLVGSEESSVWSYSNSPSSTSNPNSPNSPTRILSYSPAYASLYSENSDSSIINQSNPNLRQSPFALAHERYLVRKSEESNKTAAGIESLGNQSNRLNNNYYYSASSFAPYTESDQRQYRKNKMRYFRSINLIEPTEALPKQKLDSNNNSQYADRTSSICNIANSNNLIDLNKSHQFGCRTSSPIEIPKKKRFVSTMYSTMYSTKQTLHSEESDNLHCDIDGSKMEGIDFEFGFVDNFEFDC